MLKQNSTTDRPESVSARAAADRFPPVTDNPRFPVTRGSLAGFADMIAGKGRKA